MRAEKQLPATRVKGRVNIHAQATTMDGDQSFLDTIGFGYTQTQPDSPIGEQATPSSQHRSAITEKGKSNKGKNWSSDEDKFSKYPKWQTREVETSLKKQKKTIDASPGTATNDPADASSVRTDATSIRTDALEHEKRPDGVKKDKREEIALKKNEDARNEREDARRQFELDERIMLIDTRGMTDVQKQFYQDKQKEILARGLG
uniref:No apical meristem-associated C-terminal domain-containing protein n=1 Tax=Aegilops tauschii TaxID=37682 RepID=N1QYF7_AEGTA